jgi:hypothetical protein
MENRSAGWFGFGPRKRCLLVIQYRANPESDANSSSSSAAIYAGLVAGLMVISMWRSLYFAYAGM